MGWPGYERFRRPQGPRQPSAALLLLFVGRVSQGS